MSHTMDDDNNDNNNKGNQVLNSGVGCSAIKREKKYSIDLNEVCSSPDYSQVVVDGFHMAMGGGVELQDEVQHPSSNLSFPTTLDQGHGAEKEQVHVQNNAIALNAAILKSRKGKMPMNYFEDAPFQEVVAADEAKTISSDEQQVPNTTIGVEASSIEGMMLLQHNDISASGSSSQRKRKTDFSEHYKLPCTMINVAPKVVFRIEINEDKVNDGYRWHKYGRKEIKGNANYHRGYYRCTTKTCNVRKQVERDAQNPKYVIVSYEGKHNHGLPIITKKNSTNSSTTTATVARGNASIVSPPFALPMTQPFTPLHCSESYGSYGMNCTWPDNNPFLNMVNSTMMMRYGYTNGQHFRDCYAPHIAASQAVSSIGGFQISPPLPELRDFLQLNGYNIAAATMFPFEGAAPINHEANDNHSNE